VLCNGIACSDAYWYGVAPRLAQTRPVVRWDYRGHGHSGDPIDRRLIDVGACVDDLEAVLDDAVIERAVLVGHSYGVQVALETYRRLPRRVAAIVAVAGAPGRPLARGRDRETSESLLTALQGFLSGTPNLARRTWDTVWDSPALYRLARLLGGTTVAAPVEVMQEYFRHVRDRDPELLLDMLRAMQGHRADDVVGDLGVPLLVLAGDRDRLTPLSLLRDMALTAPRGELAIRHGGGHTLPAEHPSWVTAEIVRFLTESQVGP
jgi:pimeloyl-ACP methyl ester carboxylesterase